MTFRFWKMHGAGNDFVLIDDRDETFPHDNREWMAGIATRRTGVGGDGIVLIQPSRQADIRMRFFNPDGREAEMCGNALRCTARLARDLGLAEAAMTVETMAGTYPVVIRNSAVRVAFPEPAPWPPLQDTLDVDGSTLAYTFLNTGVPHVVINLAESTPIDDPMRALAPAIRHHPRFAPAGTNVNVYRRLDDGTLTVRTYERGVEGETLACGTGVVATALAAATTGQATAPVAVHVAGGCSLIVDFEMGHGQKPRDITLTGPAVYVYRGDMDGPA